MARENKKIRIKKKKIEESPSVQYLDALGSAAGQSERGASRNKNSLGDSRRQNRRMKEPSNESLQSINNSFVFSEKTMRKIDNKPERSAYDYFNPTARLT